MAASESIVHLSKEFFRDRERILLQHGDLSVSTFLFETGVAGLRFRNELGQLVLLPFQGQQIWSMEFCGRNLTMKSMFPEPRATRAYLETYGGFLIHCGVTAMGVPGEKDTHPLHGELPNAPYLKAAVAAGQDSRGSYVALRGEYQHTVAFSYNYLACPEVRLYSMSTRVPISMAIQNLKQTPMELMYLAHANFRPVDNGRLVYSARLTPEHVRVRTSIPSHIRPPAGYENFLAELEDHPERHHVLKPGLTFDPEVVFFIDYLADPSGLAHTLQVHPDGSADFLSHRPDQLRFGIRWICRTADQDALGLCLPATAEVEGYHAEKAKGHLRVLPPGAATRFDFEAGYLAAPEAKEMAARIEKILGS